ncbi:MAG: DUF4831 family protein [Bacteroidales bacterium]|nr:DUF4831 family protein [Bacteroidales bacterium]
MKTTSLLIGALLLGTGTSVHAQSSQRITAGKSTEYGLVYSLPLTAIDIYVEARLVEETPGEFYNYSRRHLGDAGAITTPSRSADVQSVTIVPRGVSDPENRWVAQFKAGSTPYMILDAEGVPLAINTTETAVSAEIDIPQPKSAAPSPLEGPMARQAVTQEMARSSSIAKRAELAAERIFEIRETRSDILSGQADNAPADGKAMQLVLDNLSAQEAALMAMFTGVKSETTVVQKYTLVPDSTEFQGRILGRLSPVDGLIEADNLAGAPIKVSLEIVERGQMPVNEKGERKTFPKGGVAYGIPGKAKITLEYEGSEIASTIIPMAQFGTTFGLDPALFTNKKEPSKVIFEPTTGAILTLGPAE